MDCGECFLLGRVAADNNCFGQGDNPINNSEGSENGRQDDNGGAGEADEDQSKNKCDEPS